MKKTSMALLLVLFAACATTAPPATTTTSTTPLATVQPLTDILGVRLGMPRDTVRTTLAAVGTFEREERKRQEIWTVRDPRFSSLIIGYEPDWTVRYVTGVANPAGTPIRYADVLDLSAAEERVAGNTRTYTWATGSPKYYVIAIGGPERPDYLSLKKDNKPQ